MAAALAACTDGSPTTGKGSSATSTTAKPTRTTPSGTVAPALTWATWPEYIDVDDSEKHRPTLEAFVKASGIKVTYDESIQDNVDYVGSVEAKLKAKTPIGADIVTLTTWMAAKLVKSGWVQPFGPIERQANIISALAKPDWDPDQVYSVPWQAGLTGIAYDARRVERAIGSISELFSRSDLAGKVGLFKEFNDTVGFALLAQGKEVGTASADDVGGALDLLKKQQSSKRAAFYGNEYLDALNSGKLIASMAWSGDILQASADNPYLKFVMPEEGLIIWADNLLVPAASREAINAAKLADYYYQPEVAAKVAAWVNYICPVEGAQAAMDRIDPDLAASPLIFPDSSILNRSFQLATLPTSDDDRLRADFAAIRGSAS